MVFVGLIVQNMNELAKARTKTLTECESNGQKPYSDSLCVGVFDPCNCL